MTRIINVATEDEISELIACKIVNTILPKFCIGVKMRRGGSGYLRSRMASFCQMARREPVFILTDLDRRNCPLELIDEWMEGLAVPQNLILRIPVREIESWLLADHSRIAALMRLSPAAVPADPDSLPDPKQALLTLARHAHRDVRQELLAVRGAVASQGIGYNRVLGDFVENDWSPQRASHRSSSLRRAIARLERLNSPLG